MIKFKFFKGSIKNIIFTQRRYPRVLSDQIPYPLIYTEDHTLRTIYRRGWRDCERGADVYNNPFAKRHMLIYRKHIAWERGWLECYNNHPNRQDT